MRACRPSLQAPPALAAAMMLCLAATMVQSASGAPHRSVFAAMTEVFSVKSAAWLALVVNPACIGLDQEYVHNMPWEHPTRARSGKRTHRNTSTTSARGLCSVVISLCNIGTVTRDGTRAAQPIGNYEAGKEKPPRSGSTP